MFNNGGEMINTIKAFGMWELALHKNIIQHKYNTINTINTIEYNTKHNKYNTIQNTANITQQKPRISTWTTE